MPDLLPITLQDMIDEVERELGMRERLYPQWKAAAGRNKRNQLDRQWDVMEAILKHLQGERDGPGRQMGGRQAS
jgi:hypothetical protein